MTLNAREMPFGNLGALLHLAGREELTLQRHEAPQTEKLGIDAEAGVRPLVVDQAHHHLRHPVVGEHIDLLITSLPSITAFQKDEPRLGCRQFLQDAAAVVADGPRQGRDRPSLAALSMDIGKHPNDEMVSFYSRSPSGFDVEIGCGGRLVDDATWTVAEITKPSLWGHRRPA